MPLSLCGHVQVFCYSHYGKVSSLNHQNVVGNTALHRAARAGHFDVCFMLLAAGARADIQNHSGKTPLNYAYRQGSQGLVRLLENPCKVSKEQL